jgi:hypothetical protein
MNNTFCFLRDGVEYCLKTNCSDTHWIAFAIAICLFFASEALSLRSDSQAHGIIILLLRVFKRIKRRVLQNIAITPTPSPEHELVHDNLGREFSTSAVNDNQPDQTT